MPLRTLIRNDDQNRWTKNGNWECVSQSLKLFILRPGEMWAKSSTSISLLRTGGGGREFHSKRSCAPVRASNPRKSKIHSKFDRCVAVRMWSCACKSPAKPKVTSISTKNHRPEWSHEKAYSRQTHRRDLLLLIHFRMGQQAHRVHTHTQTAFCIGNTITRTICVPSTPQMCGSRGRLAQARSYAITVSTCWLCIFIANTLHWT